MHKSSKIKEWVEQSNMNVRKQKQVLIKVFIDFVPRNWINWCVANLAQRILFIQMTMLTRVRVQMIHVAVARELTSHLKPVLQGLHDALLAKQNEFEDII